MGSEIEGDVLPATGQGYPPNAKPPCFTARFVEGALSNALLFTMGSSFMSRTLQKGRLKWLLGSASVGALTGLTIWQNRPTKYKKNEQKAFFLRVGLQLLGGVALAGFSAWMYKSRCALGALPKADLALWGSANGFFAGAYLRALGNSLIKKPKRPETVIKEWESRTVEAVIGLALFLAPTICLSKGSYRNFVEYSQYSKAMKVGLGIGGICGLGVDVEPYRG